MNSLRRKRDHEGVIVVLCNDDLDSIASAIFIAYMYKESKHLEIEKDKFHHLTHIIPIINIKRVKLNQRKDIGYFLEMNDIKLENILCRYVEGYFFSLF